MNQETPKSQPAQGASAPSGNRLGTIIATATSTIGLIGALGAALNGCGKNWVWVEAFLGQHSDAPTLAATTSSPECAASQIISLEWAPAVCESQDEAAPIAYGGACKQRRALSWLADQLRPVVTSHRAGFGTIPTTFSLNQEGANTVLVNDGPTTLGVVTLGYDVALHRDGALRLRTSDGKTTLATLFYSDRGGFCSCPRSVGDGCEFYLP